MAVHRSASGHGTSFFGGRSVGGMDRCRGIGDGRMCDNGFVGGTFKGGLASEPLLVHGSCGVCGQDVGGRGIILGSGCHLVRSPRRKVMKGAC